MTDKCTFFDGRLPDPDFDCKSDEIVARLDALTKAVEALANQLAYWEQWQREQAQWPRQVTVMERSR